jgi:hypothetical protein
MVERVYETSEQAADRLGISVVTLCRWCRQGRFPGALKHGRAWYVPSGMDPQPQGSGCPDEAGRRFFYETTTTAARRLGGSRPHIIALVERGHLQAERGPWRSYAIPAGAVPTLVSPPVR